MSDAVNPAHYKRLPAEAIEIIESMIAGAPDNKAAYLHGQGAKYDLRLWEKGKSLEDFLSDWQKHIWYALRLERHLIELVEKQTASEQQKAADLQSLKDHPVGKPEQQGWTPKIGDWVRIKKPESWMHTDTAWMQDMDKYDGEVVQVTKISNRAIVHDEWAFRFDWLEPAEQPKARAISDKIPQGYRKLNDSSVEPRQLGDLRWSVSEKRYVEISVDEIEYANRDNWAACRRVEPIVKQSLTTEPVSVFCNNHVCQLAKPTGVTCPPESCDIVTCVREMPTIKAPEVTPEVTGESEAEWIDAVWPQDWGKPARFWPNPIYQDEGTPDHKLWDLGTIAGYVSDGYRKWIIEMDGKISCQMYCQVKRKVGTLEQSPEPPDGWRWLEVGEEFFLGDTTVDSDGTPYMKTSINKQYCEAWKCQISKAFIRRNRFEVGEKVVRISNGVVYKVIRILSMGYQLESEFCAEVILHEKDLAPYIEETK